VRQGDASIRHHDHQVPQTQFETRVPADTKDDDLPLEMSSLEQCFDRNERLHSVIIPDRGLFARKPPRGGFTLTSGDRPVVLLSAGIGATPVLAMLHISCRRNIPS
jgi:hypothetical protein